MIISALLLAASVGLAEPAVAQPPKANVTASSFTVPTNAALAYFRAFGLKSDDCQKLRELELHKWDNKPTKEARELLEKTRGFQAAMVKGTAIKACDWGVDWEDGWGAHMPHLGHMRQGASVVAADARVLIEDGKSDEAVERIAQIHAMARHSGSDDVLISKLVQVAITRMAFDLTEGLIQSGALTQAGQTRLVGVVEPLTGPDAFGGKRALAGERFISCDWMKRNSTKLGGPQAFARLLTQDFGLSKDVDPVKSILALDDAGFAREIDRSCKIIETFESIWDAPDALKQFREICAKVAKGDEGPLAQWMLPDMVGSRQRFSEIEAVTREHLAKIKSAKIARAK